MAIGSGNDRRMMSEINVTPMVDVMLVLLIVFMVTAPMLQSGIDVQLPTAGTAPLGQGDRAVTITVDRSGRIHLERHSLTMEEFRMRAPALFSEIRGRPVYIMGDARISYGTIIAAMAVLKGAGVERIGLVTEPEADWRERR
ncbi:MAG: ExbD/TolR family protein [bacterium]|nr:MAG: ExbD/TolR family protein [bacterium]